MDKSIEEVSDALMTLRAETIEQLLSPPTTFIEVDQIVTKALLQTLKLGLDYSVATSEEIIKRLSS